MTKPYQSLDSSFIDTVHRMEAHELHEQQLKTAVKQTRLKNRAIAQLKAEIKEILNAEPMEPEQRTKVNAKVVKIERVIEEHYNPDQRT